MKTYFVYIMANAARTLYTGVTNNLEGRVIEHRTKKFAGFTARYNINRLMYFESWSSIVDAIGREKQIKSWRRAKKVALIESMNRDWKDRSADWFDGRCSAGARAKSKEPVRDSSASLRSASE